MIRSVFPWIVVSVAVLTTGCRMCAHPFDYDGPVVGDDCQGGCDSGARAGSIHSGTAQPIAGAGAFSALEPAPLAPTPLAPAPHEPAVLPRAAEPVVASRGGSPNIDFGVDPRMIISVTDRKLGAPDSAVPGEVSEQSPAWTARTPAGQLR